MENQDGVFEDHFYSFEQNRRKKQRISANGFDSNEQNIPSFQMMQLPYHLSAQLHDLGFSIPTAIQSQAIPFIMEGRDTFVVSGASAGKTMSYIIPILSFISNKQPTQPGEGPLVIVIAPTRLLVEKISDTIDLFINPESNPYLNEHIQTQNRQYPTQNLDVYSPLHTVIGVCGGVSHSTQISAIVNVGIDIIVATPGRLLDLVHEKVISFERLSILVFDEADHLFGITMEEHLQEIAE